ncbi:MAG TPA: alpha/beta hydrolase [Anaerolineales bacterium]|nr:alpha/beta hydrolase [Anaerolineales bacterium]
MDKMKINNLELAYVRRGKGTPLVLLHGFPLDHHLWDDIAPLLEDRFDLILPDLRGFGESTTVDAPYSMDDYASDIAGLLDQLGIQKAVIAGHSMGGYVALAFASLYPARVSGLALISSQVLADPPDRKEGRYKSAADVAEKGIGDVVEAMTSKFTSDARLQTIARSIMEKQKPGAYIGALKAMAERTDSTSLLSTFKFPVMVVHGEADALIPVARAHEVKAALPDSYYVELKDTGHVPMLEAAKETAEALLRLA